MESQVALGQGVLSEYQNVIGRIDLRAVCPEAGSEV